MNLRRILSIVVMVALVGGGTGFLMLRGDTVTIRATGAVAAPLMGDPGALRVFATLHNDGGPDRLIAAGSPVARTVEIVSRGGGITLPAQSAPMLAADGAHLRMTGVGALGDGAVIPLMLHFASGAVVATRAVLSDPMARGDAGELGLTSLGGICRVGPGEPAPQIAIEVTQDGVGWRVHVTSEEFRFTEIVEGLGHVPGYGHGHLYLDGVKLQRMYAPDAGIGALPPGDHTVEVTLNTNDHRAYVVDGVPVTATATLHNP